LKIPVVLADLDIGPPHIFRR